MRRWFFNILIYLSLLFLVVFLYKYNYIDIQGISFRPLPLVGSIVLLCIGFVATGLAWRRSLSVHSIKISKRDAIVSHGLSIFAKFIPGKVWVVLGRASKVSMQGFSLKTTSYASLKEQLVYIWLGLLQALVFFLIFHPDLELLLIVLLLFLGLTLFNFSGWLRGISTFVFKKIFKREFDVPRLGTKEVLALIGNISLYWIFWNLGFWLFVSSVIADIHPAVALVFPLSVTLGLLAIIVPGGLGVREGLIVLGLTAMGVEVELSTTIAIAARLWYTVGELFFFVLALMLNIKKRKE
jgi:glycosyltransferase 2 family protein